MRIVHFSDLHGNYGYLPPADVYVCSGDQLPNFSTYFYKQKDGSIIPWQINMHLFGENVPKPGGDFVGRSVDPKVEEHLQSRFVANRGLPLRVLFGTPDAPVVCCRGNHDFIDLSLMFGGETYEIGTEPTTFTIDWVKFGGIRGINQIIGEWSDEIHPTELSRLSAMLPEDIDVLVTHAPPRNILDRDNCGENLGVDGFASYINRRLMDESELLAHLFGHIHHSYGRYELGGAIFSNAATGYQVIDI